MLPGKGHKRRIPRGRYNVRGVVLHTLKYGDRKLIVHLLTADGRRSYITAVGNGTRSLFQPLFILDLEATPGRGELHTIEQSQAAVVFGDIPFDIAKSAIALFLSELLYRLIKEGEADAGLYGFVEDAVAGLDLLREPAATANFHLWFLVQLSGRLGYAPRDNYKPGFSLDYRNGYYTAEPQSHTLVMRPDEAGLFRALSGSVPSDLHTIALDRHRRVAMLEKLVDLYGFHTDAIYSVNSLRILSEIF